MTARMRFMIAKLTSTRAETKKALVMGASSMSGTVTMPQESPAMICCMKVRTEDRKSVV